MKIVVVCANGRVGQLVVKEAVDRGMEVTAIARGENKSVAPRFISKDVFDLTADDLSGFDAVVDAFGAWTPETIPGIPAAMKHLADLVAGTDTRLLVVGGAGSLFVNPEHTATLDMGPDFPEDWKPLSAAHGEGLADLRARTDVKWTYVSPAADFQADGPRTGSYILGGEELTLSEDGVSEVSYANYAIAMVDEIEAGEHVCERISVVRK
ncbi:MAG TPA: NAD(P)H-binding protein [Collinsella ihuae]|uniref:NAD(P)H-binding protein n=1 Tax=Collinsella ihumii TaxID=1720204 RepID=A0A921LSJ0_9ACTN|nr:NAD(P)H-binding protein [Collinsella ihumii]